MSRPAVARVHLEHIVDNFQLATSLCPESGQALAVIKADAYGHGAVRVAQALEPHVPAFAVACIEEALELRQGGIQKPILLLEGFFTADELPVIAEQGFWTAVHRPEQLAHIREAALPVPLNVWIKIDSGMHRLGFDPEVAGNVVRQAQSMPEIGNIVVMSHFANADLDAPAGINPNTQVDRLLAAVEGLDVDFSLANSAALLAHPFARQQWQRPGIMLYGASPLETDNADSSRLKPGMTLESAVIATRWVQPGESVGYGSRFVADKPTRVGTVAIGYADGYPRQAVDGTPLAVDGQRTRLIGRVSMDMITVDLTDIDGADVGSKVELWGEQIDANDVAAHCDTIAYHLFTGVTRRVPRVY
ncbi:MAG: alanine racemase [Oceanospirillaceae bacterium]|nr:alanine racemase [Oceanospirillaceae bacterium]